jgi:hypothetical protein
VTGEALGVLVGQQVALGQLHCHRAVVLTGDQLDIRALVGQLLSDRGSYLGRNGSDCVQIGVERGCTRIDAVGWRRGQVLAEQASRRTPRIRHIGLHGHRLSPSGGKIRRPVR